MGDENLPQERMKKLAEEFAEWKRQLSENQTNLLDLQYQFFESSLMYLIEIRDRMIDDQMKFGKDNFEKTSGIFLNLSNSLYLRLCSFQILSKNHTYDVCDLHLSNNKSYVNNMYC